MAGDANIVIIVLYMDKWWGRELFILNPKKGASDMELKALGSNLRFPTYYLCDVEANR